MRRTILLLAACAAVAAAVGVAREQEGRIVVLIADGGERYLSTPPWE